MRNLWSSAALLFALAVSTPPAFAAPWLWDQDQNRIDDRIEAVNLNGLAAAHRNNDLNDRLLLFVYPESTPLEFGVYVGYDHHPTDDDVAALAGTGARLLWRPRYMDYLRARASFAQIQALAGLPGVTRVEAWQVMVAFNDNATRTLRARDSQGGVGAGMFPSVWKDLGITGRGVVVGILDTGVNDAASGPYPGHESLRGKFVGGGDFSNPDASLNTPPDSSSNPSNSVDPEGSYHGTHVAGTAIGSGGPEGVLNGAAPGSYAGMAPDARLVDCKVLSDAGVGGGAAEALEWCIVHRNTVWGTDPSGAELRGVQVVNMSLGGLNNSDGTDADCAAVNAAVKAGIVVCIATGNDGSTSYMPSPAAADNDIAVGALTDANTLQHGDDVVADYSNEGPRTGDGDADHLDEMKPSVLGSGSDIVSALGDPTTDGQRYHNINGTSMATPTVVGLCALILQANPRLTPLQVRAVLQNTAEHRTDHGKQPPSAADPFHLDPNYHPSWGWGEPDAYAAVKEALDPYATQVIAEDAGPAALVGGQLEVPIRWATQRENDVRYFGVYRAPDLGGTAGDFAAVSPDIPHAGRFIIERATNRTAYAWTDRDPALVPGDPYWYQVRWTDSQGRQHIEPAFRVATDARPVRARVSWIIEHEALDNDVFARFGSGADAARPAFVRPCGGSGAADSVRLVQNAIFYQIHRYFFHADLTDDDFVRDFLPPSAANPWFLSVLEKGFVDTRGVVDSFSVTVYDGSTSTTFRAPNPPTPTVEGQTTVLWIPLDPATSPNHNPVLDPIGDRTGDEGIGLAFQVHGNDPDAQALAYAATAVPSGAAFDAGTQTFSWTPGFGQAGSYQIVFHATDTMGAADSANVALTIRQRQPGDNSPPVLTSISDKATPAERGLSFTLSATDREGGPLDFSATALPAGAAFDSTTRAFSWTPQFADEGTHRVVFHVADLGGLADSQAVLVTVTPANPPFPADCTPDTATFGGTIGVNVQGALDVSNFHPFTVDAGTAEVRGLLSWSGAPAVDLDLYLLDPSGNLIGSGATATSDPELATYVLPAAGTYQWKVSSFDNPNANLAYTVTSIRCTNPALAVGDAGHGASLALGQNEPNPFSRTSVIRFALPASGEVNLRIYDVAGRVVRTLVSGRLDAGYHQRVWDGREDGGGPARAGVYFYHLGTAQGTRSRKMILIH